MPRKDGRPHVTYDAPVVPISYPLDDELVTVHACDYCLPWSVDVSRDDEDQVVITEWHAAECQFVADWLSAGEEHAPPE